MTEEKREGNFQKYYKEHATGVAVLHTPKNIRDKMTHFVKTDDKILVIFNIDILVDLILSGHRVNNILFMSDDEKRNLLIDDMNIETKYFKHHQEIPKLLVGKHFNIVLTNSPARKNNIDIRILKHVYEFTDKIVIIASSGIFIHRPSKLKDSIKKMLKNNFNQFIDTEYHFPDGWGKSIFYFEKTKLPLVFDDFHQHGSSDIFKSIKYKILKRAKESNIHYKIKFGYKQTTEKLLNLSHMSHPGSLPIRLKPIKSLKFIKFKTKKEKDFFTHYLKTKIIRFCYSLYDDVLASYYDSIPDMSSYAHDWTDEEIAEEIGLTTEELEWIFERVQNYYPDDEEIYGNRKMIKINNKNDMFHHSKKLVEQRKM